MKVSSIFDERQMLRKCIMKQNVHDEFDCAIDFQRISISHDKEMKLNIFQQKVFCGFFKGRFLPCKICKENKIT